MKTFCFVLLSGFVIYFSSHAVQGRLVFAQDSSIDLEGSNATFTCQDTEKTSALKITWSFQNGALHRVLSENGTLAPGVNIEKYKLLKSGTKLEITNLAINDSGNYKCKILGENGDALLSAMAALNVETLFRDEQVTNTSLVFVSSTPPAVSSVPYSLQPSPSTAYIQSAMMRRTVFYETSSVTAEGYIVRTVSEERAPCANSTEHTEIAFIKDKTSPNLITVNEGRQLKLECNYCARSPVDTVLSWYKEGLQICNDTHHVINKNEVGVPVAEHSRDEGLYKCLVTSKNQNISKFITVIVKKADPNPLLSSVLAQNKSYLSVQVTWHLTDHGVFSSAVVSLGLRLLNSIDWSHVISNISQPHGLHKFDNLQPGREYLLNLTLHNKYKQTESRALVFWSAATNSSEADHGSLLLYQVTNRRALGVALGIIGLLVLVMIMYACVTWCQDDKRGYSLPPGQQKRSEVDENDSLFSVTSSMYYNRAFEDDKLDWMADEEILS